MSRLVEENWYYNSIRDIPEIDGDRICELWTEYKNGNDESGKELYTHFLRPAFSVAVKYASEINANDEVFNDLIQTANVGVRTAFETFDKEVSSSTIISWVMQNCKWACLNFIKYELTNIKLPVGIVTTKQEIRRVLLENPEMSEDDYNAIAKKVGCKESTVKEAVIASGNTYPLSTLESEDDTHCQFEEFIEQKTYDTPDGYMSKREMTEEVADICSVLNDDERKVIELRYGIFGNEEHSFQRIGEILGLSKQRVNQIEKKALKKMKGKAIRMSKGLSV